MEIDIHQASRGKKRTAATANLNKKKPAQQAQIQKAMLQMGETKYFDKLITTVGIGNSMAAAVVSPAGGIIGSLATGNTSLTRVGKKIRLMSLRVKARLQMPAQALTAGGLAPQSIRFAIVRDKEPQGAAIPINSDVFSTVANAAADLMGFQNQNNIGRWQVLHDKIVVIQDSNLVTTGVNGRAIFLKKNIKFGKTGLTLRYSDTDHSVTDQFHIVCYAITTDGAPTVTVVSRACFKDE